MSDLISRQDAIKAFYNPENGGTYSEFDDGSEWYMTSKQIYAVLESLPSAEPPYQYSEAYVMQLRGERDILQDMVNNMADRPTGEWIGDKCSICGTERAWYGEQPNYCPDCGAKMGGDAE